MRCVAIGRGCAAPVPDGVGSGSSCRTTDRFRQRLAMGGAPHRIGLGNVVRPGRRVESCDHCAGCVVHVDERDVAVGLADQRELPALCGGVEACGVRAVGCHEHREAQHDSDAAGVGDTGSGGLRDGDRVRGPVVVPFALLVDPMVTAVDVREGDRLLDEPRYSGIDRRRAAIAGAASRRRASLMRHADGSAAARPCRDVGGELSNAVVPLKSYPQRRAIEQVDFDGRRSGGSHSSSLLRRPHDRGDLCPASTRRGTNRRPSTPVAPVTNTL